MRNQDIVNKFYIYKLVRDYFCLSKESLKLFKYRLFYEPHINPMYKKIIGNSKDLRKRVALDPSLLQSLDRGWSLFRREFYSFCNAHSVSYNNFRDNSIEYNNGQTYKLKKALLDYYSKSLKIAIKDLGFEYDLGNIIKLKNKDLKNYRSFFEEPYFKFIEYTGYRSDYEIKKQIHIEDVKVDKEIREALENRIMQTLEEIGAIRLPNKKLSIVLSLNFADWLLSSSSEDWSSCLDLESDYDECFWTGLPGLIGDKNRALLYITDGKKKKYGKIKVDRILSRSWVLTVRTKSTKKPYFHFVTEYPINIGLDKFAEEYLGVKFITRGEEEFISRYYMELLYHDVGFYNYLAYIYQDSTSFHFAKKNKAKYFPKKYGYLKSGGGYHPSIVVDKKSNKSYSDSENGFRFSSGLSGLGKNELRDCFEGDEEDEEDAANW